MVSKDSYLNKWVAILVGGGVLDAPRADASIRPYEGWLPPRGKLSAKRTDEAKLPGITRKRIAEDSSPLIRPAGPPSPKGEGFMGYSL